MQYKKVGQTGLKVSAFGIGTMYFGNQIIEPAINIIDTAFEKGIHFFDTANAYSGGRSEEILGKAINNKRQAVVLATKVGHKQGPGVTQFSLAWILNNRSISSIIIGPSSTKQLEENIQATDLRLTAEETKTCDEVWSELRPPRIFYGK